MVSLSATDANSEKRWRGFYNSLSKTELQSEWDEYWKTQLRKEDLAKTNKNFKNENQELKELLTIQNQKLTQQNQRLENLEQIALGNFNSKELVSSLQ